MTKFSIKLSLFHVITCIHASKFKLGPHDFYKPKTTSNKYKTIAKIHFHFSIKLTSTNTLRYNHNPWLNTFSHESLIGAILTILHFHFSYSNPIQNSLSHLNSFTFILAYLNNIISSHKKGEWSKKDSISTTWIFIKNGK